MIANYTVITYRLFIIIFSINLYFEAKLSFLGIINNLQTNSSYVLIFIVTTIFKFYLTKGLEKKPFLDIIKSGEIASEPKAKSVTFLKIIWCFVFNCLIIQNYF